MEKPCWLPEASGLACTGLLLVLVVRRSRRDGQPNVLEVGRGVLELVVISFEMSW